MTGRLGEELARVLHRNRRAFRYTQVDLGQRIGVSGSYISSIEAGKASPRFSELEDLATHFRTTALDLLLTAARADEDYIPATETPAADLDTLAADLAPEHKELAREFILFLRERDRVDSE
jgi:transcriptional regulator with XRE-family HTH domain